MTSQEFIYELSAVPFAKYRAMKAHDLFRYLADELEANRLTPEQSQTIVGWYLYRKAADNNFR